MQLKLSPKARQNFKNIVNFTRKVWGTNQRDRYIELVDAAFQRIAVNPAIGKRRDDVKPGYLSYPVSKGRHLIFYRVQKEHIRSCQNPSRQHALWATFPIVPSLLKRLCCKNAFQQVVK